MLKTKYRLQDDMPAEGGGEPAAAPASPVAWSDALPESVRQWDEVTQSPEPDKFWEQMSHLRSKVGTGIYPPAEDSSPEARQAFLAKVRKHAPELMPAPSADDADGLQAVYDAMGRPKDAAEYKLAADMPDGVNANSDAIAKLKGIAHKAGLSQSQFNDFVGEVLSGDVARATAQQEELSGALKDLRGEWGNAYDSKMSSIQKLVESTGAPAELVNGLENENIGAATLKWLDGLTTRIGTEGMPLSNDSNEPGSLTPMQAKDEIQSIMSDRGHAYFKASHPMHAHAKARMRELRLAETAGDNGSITIGAGAVGGGTIGT